MSPPRTYVVHAVVVAGLALTTIALAVGGCGGAATQDVLEADPKATSSSGTSGTSGTSGASGTSGSGTSGGTSGSSGSSGGGDASVDATAQCPNEIEPNNSRDAANTLAPTLCGVISPKSESDFLTFILKPTSTSMRIDFTGKVLLKVDVNGQTVTLGAGGTAPPVPFVKGARYVIEIKSVDNNNTTPWRVDLIEK